MGVSAKKINVIGTIEFQQIKVKIDVNIHNEGEEHIQKDGNNVALFKTFPFTFFIDDLEIFGDFWIREDKPNDEGKNRTVLGLTLYNMKAFVADMEMHFSNVENQRKLIECVIKSSIFRNSRVLRSKIHNDKFPEKYEYASVQNEFFLDEKLSSKYTSMKSQINILIKASKSPTKNNENQMQNFVSILSHEAVSQFAQDNNFSMICQEEEFKFNKYLLSMISEVFARMIQASNSKEALSNSMVIDDFAPDTIRAFQRVAFGNEEIKDEDLTPELLMFAQKYLIKPLVAKIKNKLMDSMTNENIFDLIKVAYLIDDEDMFKEACKHLKEKKDELKDSVEWKTFGQDHPACMIKALTSIV